LIYLCREALWFTGTVLLHAFFVPDHFRNGGHFRVGEIRVMRHLAIYGLVAFCAAALASASASAQSIGVEPLFLEVAPNESSALRVRNSSPGPVTVEIEVEERMVDENGVQTRKPADDDFLLFPPQAVVQPSSLQVFRMQPIAADPTRSKSYFVTVRQVPVKLPNEESGVRLRVVFAFDSAVHVVPRNTRSEAVLVSAAPSRMEIEVPTEEFKTESNGAQTRIVKKVEVPAVEFVVRNDGSRYYYLQNLQFDGTFTDATKGQIKLPDWSQNDILKAIRVSLVTPGATRKFKLPLAEGDSPTAVTATAKLVSER
jgi:fimbrial chaperone protein